MTSRRIGVGKGLFTVPEERPPAEEAEALQGLDDALTLQSLLEVLEVLRHESVGAKMQFLLNGRGSLTGLTPLKALERPKLRAKVKGPSAGFRRRPTSHPTLDDLLEERRSGRPYKGPRSR